MESINVKDMQSGDIKIEFEKLDEQTIREYVVQVRDRSVAEQLAQADEIDRVAAANLAHAQTRAASDAAHTAKIREALSREVRSGDALER